VIKIGKIISFLFTLIILGLINYGIATITNTGFIEISTFVAFASVIIVYFFSSTGGFTSRSVDLQIQGQTGMKMNQPEGKFAPSYAFFASILYLAGSIIATFIVFKEYF
jgi:hypothetical protein